jgi:hypothetical protein
LIKHCDEEIIETLTFSSIWAIVLAGDSESLFEALFPSLIILFKAQETDPVVRGEVLVWCWVKQKGN